MSKVWVTAEGEKIPYANLTDQHLRNIIRYLNRTPYADPSNKLGPILVEIEYRQLKLNSPRKDANMTLLTERAKRITEKNNDNDEALQAEIAGQITLLTGLDDGLDQVHDLLNDALETLVEETADDVYNLGTMKENVVDLMGKINTWREEQNARL